MTRGLRIHHCPLSIVNCPFLSRCISFDSLRSLRMTRELRIHHCPLSIVNCPLSIVHCLDKQLTVREFCAKLPMYMIEARRIISISCRETFAGLWQGRKGSSPKGSQAKAFPGQANKICLTVAFAECYHGAAGSVCLSQVIADVRIGCFLLKGSSYHEKSTYF